MSTARRYLFDEPGTYRIRIQGRFDASGPYGLGCITNCTGRVRGTPPVTTLTGVLPDQAGLISVLTQLYDMGYPLLQLKRLPQSTALSARRPTAPCHGQVADKPSPYPGKE